MILRIYPLGPYRAGARQVSGVEDIGTDAAHYLPPPTTALGAYATAVDAVHGDDAASALGCEEVWGPLVEIRGRSHFAAGELLFAVEKLRQYVDAAVEGGDPPEADYCFETYGKPGTALKDKAVQHLYYANFVWVKGVRPGELAFLYYLKCREERRVEAVVNFGGEGRLAEVKTETEGPGPRPGRTGVLLSPLLFYAEGPWAEAGRDRGLEAVEAVHGVYEGGRYKAKSGYYGLGYSIGLRRRRALMQGLPPGTAVTLKTEDTHAGLYKRWGFGSILAI